MKADMRPAIPHTSGQWYFNPRAPIRDLQEVARIMGLTYNQAKYLEKTALIKLRPALVAYGYREERP